MNQIIRFFRKIFGKFLFDFCFSKQQNKHTIKIKNAKLININVYSMFYLQFEKPIKQVKKILNKELRREFFDS